MGQFLSSAWAFLAALRGTNSKRLTSRDVPDAEFSGRWIIVSGANSGVGFEAAKQFARMGANLILACRDPPSRETHPLAAVEECRSIATAAGHPKSTIEWWKVEMSEMSSVEAFAQRWLDTGRPLDVLCNNAGMTSLARKKFTGDGFERVHQVNFLSHVLLTLRLLPSIARSDYARIICSTSCLHYLAPFDMEHFNGERGIKGDPYAINKLYFQMWLVELQQRLLQHAEYEHITINGVHPGFVDSGIWAAPEGDTKFWLRLLIFSCIVSVVGVTSAQGGICLVNAATNPKFSKENGGGKFINRIWEDTQAGLCADKAARLTLWNRLADDMSLREKGLLKLLEN
ncbi:unnamed protein product [Clonostachys byssicola]|uniref:Uncharacterized protein n=1 Tax=Clonostachys byssicola TaxID=160290 RepID=A0A9N9U872_9HYPO|nr:unnamed protein product [Clonostachys byssicola]